jgi:hypothetical protein
MRRAKSTTGYMRPEFDFASMKSGVRGKYVGRFREGTTIVLIEPDLARAFPTAAAVNRALRAIIVMSEALRPSRKSVSKSGRQKRQRRG